MEPLAVLALVVNIITLLEKARKLISLGSEIAKSGSSSSTGDLQAVLDDFKKIIDKVAGSFSPGDVQESHAADLDQLSDDNARRQEPSDDHVLESLAQRSSKKAEQLSSLLGKLSLDGSNRKRKRDVARTTLQTVWRQTDVDRLEKEFSRLQQELNFQQCYLISNKLSAINQSIKDLSHTNEKLHRRFRRQFDKLLKDVRNIADPITSGLVYDGIYFRRDKISEAYIDTFTWSFDKCSTSFSPWARTSNGIFWITGKAGCGKSTLMKYLSSHTHVQDLLKEWALDKKLVVASYYFWVKGTPLQRSQLGLLRSLLLQILKKCPELAPVAAPTRCEDLVQASLPWTEQELSEALLAIAREPSLSKCFCFFIDGLDEYDGRPAEIIQTLESLVRSPFIKVCAASRPWNIFELSYGSDFRRKLVVEDLTASDIENYITGTLRANANFRALEQRSAEAKSLADEIRRKAQGVFLWVFLVVRELLDGLSEGDDLVTLERRVEQFPDTLDQFFRRMLFGLHPVYRQESARILLSALYWKGDLPMYAPRFICTECTDPDYAWQMPIYRDERADIATTRQHLNARCRDLLEVQHYHRVRERTVAFLHRTVVDFLETKEVHDYLFEHAGPSFNVYLANLKAVVAILKSSRMHVEDSPLQTTLERSMKKILYGSKKVIEGQTPSFGHQVLSARNVQRCEVPQLESDFSRSDLRYLTRATTENLLRSMTIAHNSGSPGEASDSTADLDALYDLSGSNEVVMSIESSSFEMVDKLPPELMKRGELRRLPYALRFRSHYGPVAMLVETARGRKLRSTEFTEFDANSAMRIHVRLPTSPLGTDLAECVIAIGQVLLCRLALNQ